MDFKEQISLQTERQQKFSVGEYYLDDDEGYFCENCGWRGLTGSIPDDWDADTLIECPECGSDSPDLRSSLTDWERVKEKLE